MNTALTVILTLAGMLFVLGELCLPGGILGIAGVLFLLLAVFMLSCSYGIGAGAIALFVIALLLCALLFCWFRFFPSTRQGKELIPDYESPKDWNCVNDTSPLPGDEGVALTPLRPCGIADFGGRRKDVVTQGGFLPKGAEIKVLSVEGNRIVVDLK